MLQTFADQAVIASNDLARVHRGTTCMSKAVMAFVRISIRGEFPIRANVN